MPTVTMRLDTSRWQAALTQLGARADVAVARGLNRTGASERTALARAVSKDMGITVGNARNAIAVQKATRTNLAVRVVARGKRLPLIDFKARGTYPSLGRGRGVSYVIRGERKRLPTAFITVVSRAGEDGQHAGHRGVFIRLGKKRLPIKQLYGVSIAKSFEHLIPVAEARRAEVLLKNVQHEIEYELSRLAAASGPTVNITDSGATIR